MSRKKKTFCEKFPLQKQRFAGSAILKKKKKTSEKREREREKGKIYLFLSQCKRFQSPIYNGKKKDREILFLGGVCKKGGKDGVEGGKMIKNLYPSF